MDRKRWETAIRCLEIAVHPNTRNEEAIAAINGFRRTVNRMPLSELFRELTAPSPTHLHARLDQLHQENRALRRKVAEADAARAAALRRLQEIEKRAAEIGDELLAAEHRADMAQQHLAEFRGAYGRISGGLHHENADLRHALDEARRNLMQPIHEPVQPFQTVLNAALQRPTNAAAAASPRPATSAPWTA